MSNVFPIPRPPVPPAWCGHPGHPDFCDCGCGAPCPPSTVDAWREMARFKDMLRCIIDEMGITAKPLPGVIDGSDAKPGEVGEFIRMTAPFSFGAYPAVTNTNAAVGVIPPGDWDLFGFVDLTTQIGAMFANSIPAPPEFTDLMTANIFEATVAAGAVANVVMMNTVRANVTVPRLLNFQITVNQAGNSAFTAGTGKIIVTGRRQR